MNSIIRDFRYGLRMLWNNPGVSAIAVIALGLGIGVTATMFSIVYGAMMRGLPFEDAERILHIGRVDITEEQSNMDTPIHDYLDWRAQQTTFEDLGAYYTGTVNVRGTDAPDRYEGAFITASAFEILGVQPILGRTFLEGEDTPDAEPVALLSHHLWTDRFEADPSIIGQTIRANGEPMTVVGVMPEGFLFPIDQDIWLPLRLDPVALPRGQGTHLDVFGMLRADATVDAAEAEFVTMARQIELEYPETNENLSTRIQPFTHEFVGPEAIALLYVMLGAVFLVLLIACANVANLLLSRAFDRSKEVAIRTALGAGRGRVITQILIEASVLALVGAVIGVILANVGSMLFENAVADTQPPFFMDFSVDAPILVFILGITTLATLLAGTLPALQVTRGNLNEVLADEARGSSSFKMGRLSRALVVLQVAMSCGLLVAAGLMTKSVVNLGNNDYGFDPDNIMTARVGLFPTDYPEIEDRRLFFEDLQRRLESRSGVLAATLTPSLPVTFANNWRITVEGESYAEEAEQPIGNTAAITPGFFETFDVGLLQGRNFNVMDTADSLQVAIINTSFAEKLFAERDPLGKRFSLGDVGSETAEEWLTVVGIVPDLYMNGPLNERPEGFYVPLAQSDAQCVSIAVRTQGDPLSFSTMLREEVMAIDGDLPLYWMRTMAGGIEEETWFYWVFGALFMVFGVVALVLASVGLYGVMSFAVRRRTHEVGIRMALGAESRGVLGLVIRQGMFQLGLGLALGLLLAGLLANLMQMVLYQVEPTDSTTFVSIVATLLVTGLLACFLPALRASRVDPMIALRRQ